MREKITAVAAASVVAGAFAGGLPAAAVPAASEHLDRLERCQGAADVVAIPQLCGIPVEQPTALEVLIEKLAACQNPEDFRLAIQGQSVEKVEDAIACQDTQPRRSLLMRWLETRLAPL